MKIYSVDFPNLPSTNYAWYNAEEVSQSLNEHAIRATILGVEDEDDVFIGVSTRRYWICCSIGTSY
ncbi:MAG: hypothetical protein IPL23_30720 [Saprospiraceae bacterium]|nr:hypothetical protein [Saprospiraceae bacterium]